MHNVSTIALFCEDIREEKSGTDILVGLYLDNLNLPYMPGALPKLSIYLRINWRVEYEIVGPIPVRLEGPQGILQLGGFEPELIERTIADAKTQGNPLVGIISRASFGMFNVAVPGRVQILATVNGEDIICGTLNFGLVPTTSSSETEQPSLQSPDAAPQLEPSPEPYRP